MPILGAIIVPHPPLILPAVGRGQEKQAQATIDAYRAAAQQAADWNPEVLVVTSPHTVMYADYFHISPGRGAAGDMSAFGAAQTKLRVEYDAPLRDEIIRRAESAGLRAGTLGERDPSLDHGTFLPLYFLREAGGGPTHPPHWPVQVLSPGPLLAGPVHCPVGGGPGPLRGVHRQRRAVPQAAGGRTLRLCPGGSRVRPADHRGYGGGGSPPIPHDGPCSL